MNNLINMLNITQDTDKIIYVIKLFFITICTYYTFMKVTNKKETNFIKITFTVFLTGIICVICGEIKYTLDYLSSLICLVLLLGMLYSIINKNEFIHNIACIIICLSINYVIFFIAIALNFLPNVLILDANNDWLNLFIMIAIHIILLYGLFKIKRFKNGFQFLQENDKTDYFYIIILNISITIILSFIVGKSGTILHSSKLIIILLALTVIIFMTIKKTLTMYYKHKMLVKDLEETKEELEKTKKDRDKLEQENLKFSKMSHSIAHKQKSLENKLNKLMMNNEIGEELNIKNRIDKISEEYSSEKAVVELSKTGIVEIDDMLDCMQTECIKNNIDVELQLSGNIYHMTNNFVSKEELEILLADHIKDAIIAVQHSDNINRSILVRLGLIDEFYSLYIYDTGIEFEIDTLINLGTKPITTHADEDGTGMGFLNTFDTLKKHKASMVIDEIGKPCKDNYTKVIMIKFDGKDEFKVKSYRLQEIGERNINNNMKLI